MSDTIDQSTAAHDDFMAESLLPRTLLGGTASMRAANKTYLPQNRFETTTNYNARIDRSFLFNAYKQTVSFLTGQVFQRKVDFVGDDEEAIDTINGYSRDIDHRGNDLNVFAKRAFYNGISKGCTHILVEVPNAIPATTKQEEKDSGIRPYLKEVKAEDVIGWVADEQGKLSQVRIKGTKTVKDGRYGTRIVPTILLLEAGTWAVYEANDKGEFDETPTDSGTTNLSYIPIVTFIPAEERTIMTGEPPLGDLAYLNLKHWQSSSDQNNILHVGRVPVMFGKMLDAKSLEVGTAKMINSSDEKGDLKFVEISGAAIDAGRQDLEDTKVEMAIYGLQQLMPDSAKMLATVKTLSSNESNSSLSTWAVEFEDVLNSAFAIMADFMGQKIDGNVVELNKEYLVNLDTATLEAIFESVTMGMASRKMAFEELKRRGVYENDYTWEDVKDEIEEDSRNTSTFTELSNNLLGGVE